MFNVQIAIFFRNINISYARKHFRQGPSHKIELIWKVCIGARAEDGTIVFPAPPPLSPLMRNGGFLGRAEEDRERKSTTPKGAQNGNPLLPSWHKQKMLRETLSSGHDKWRLGGKEKERVACLLAPYRPDRRGRGREVKGRWENPN